jgi:hypothetical protein
MTSISRVRVGVGVLGNKESHPPASTEQQHCARETTSTTASSSSHTRNGDQAEVEGARPLTLTLPISTSTATLNRPKTPVTAATETQEFSGCLPKSPLVQRVEQVLPHCTVTHQSTFRSVFCLPKHMTAKRNNVHRRYGEVTVVLDVRVASLIVYAYSAVHVTALLQQTDHQRRRMRDLLFQVNPSLLIGNLEVTRNGNLRFRHAMSFFGLPLPSKTCIFHMIHRAISSLENLFPIILKAVLHSDHHDHDHDHDQANGHANDQAHHHVRVRGAATSDTTAH